jgi:UDP-N-acetylglucosamine acyltransferase
MAYSHVAHDCVIGNSCVFANGATLAGHIVVDDYVTISAFCAVHQFCNLGAYSFLAYAAMVNKDVLPYLMIAGNDPKTFGLNKVGLERRGFSKETINKLQDAYKIIFKKGLILENAKLELQALLKECPEVQLLLDCIERAKRGIIR